MIHKKALIRVFFYALKNFFEKKSKKVNKSVDKDFFSWYNLGVKLKKRGKIMTNLKNQIKQVEGYWYYEDYKTRLVINEEEAIFDNCIKFNLVRKFDADIIVEEDYTVNFEGETYTFKKGEVIEGLGEYHILYCDGEDISNKLDYSLYEDGSNALELICLYIANFI